MFQSLGNIQKNQQAGICFIDFETGNVLQLTGRARVEWNPPEDDQPLSAHEMRVVHFSIELVRRSHGPVTNYRWTLRGFSPYNPSLGVQEVVTEDSMLDSGSSLPALARLVQVRAESPAVKTFRFQLPRPIKWLPGQYATFRFENNPAIHATEKSPTIRTWTISDAASFEYGATYLEVSIKRKIGGLVSCWLHDHAKLDLQVTVSKIGGDLTPFRYPRMPSKLLLISSGIGITPNIAILRGMVKHLRLRANTSTELADVVLVHQERSEDMLAFQSALQWLLDSVKGFSKLVNVITKPVDERSVGNEVRCHGRIGKDLLRQHVSDISERMVFLCGPPGFMQTVGHDLSNLGVDPQSIHTEEFNF
jgi:uncharacterized protein